MNKKRAKNERARVHNRCTPRTMGLMTRASGVGGGGRALCSGHGPNSPDDDVRANSAAEMLVEFAAPSSMAAPEVDGAVRGLFPAALYSPSDCGRCENSSFMQESTPNLARDDD